MARRRGFGAASISAALTSVADFAEPDGKDALTRRFMAVGYQETRSSNTLG